MCMYEWSWGTGLEAMILPCHAAVGSQPSSGQLFYGFSDLYLCEETIFLPGSEQEGRWVGDTTLSQSCKDQHLTPVCWLQMEWATGDFQTCRCSYTHWFPPINAILKAWYVSCVVIWLCSMSFNCMSMLTLFILLSLSMWVICCLGQWQAMLLWTLLCIYPGAHKHKFITRYPSCGIVGSQGMYIFNSLRWYLRVFQRGCTNWHPPLMWEFIHIAPPSSHCSVNPC